MKKIFISPLAYISLINLYSCGNDIQRSNMEQDDDTPSIPNFKEVPCSTNSDDGTNLLSKLDESKIHTWNEIKKNYSINLREIQNIRGISGEENKVILDKNDAALLYAFFETLSPYLANILVKTIIIESYKFDGETYLENILNEIDEILSKKEFLDNSISSIKGKEDNPIYHKNILQKNLLYILQNFSNLESENLEFLYAKLLTYMVLLESHKESPSKTINIITTFYDIKTLADDVEKRTQKNPKSQVSPTEDFRRVCYVCINNILEKIYDYNNILTINDSKHEESFADLNESQNENKNEREESFADLNESSLEKSNLPENFSNAYIANQTLENINTSMILQGVYDGNDYHKSELILDSIIDTVQKYTSKEIKKFSSTEANSSQTLTVKEILEFIKSVNCKMFKTSNNYSFWNLYQRFLEIFFEENPNSVKFAPVRNYIYTDVLHRLISANRDPYINPRGTNLLFIKVACKLILIKIFPLPSSGVRKFISSSAISWNMSMLTFMSNSAQEINELQEWSKAELFINTLQHVSLGLPLIEYIGTLYTKSTDKFTVDKEALKELDSLTEEINLLIKELQFPEKLNCYKIVENLEKELSTSKEKHEQLLVNNIKTIDSIENLYKTLELKELREEYYSIEALVPIFLESLAKFKILCSIAKEFESKYKVKYIKPLELYYKYIINILLLPTKHSAKESGEFLGENFQNISDIVNDPSSAITDISTINKLRKVIPYSTSIIVDSNPQYKKYFEWVYTNSIKEIVKELLKTPTDMDRVIKILITFMSFINKEESKIKNVIF